MATCFVQQPENQAFSQRPTPLPVNNRNKQCGGMASREDESVTIRPDRIFRVKSQKLLPQHVYNRCHGHGSSWMTGVRLLDGIHAESPDCIYREGVDVRILPRSDQ